MLSRKLPFYEIENGIYEIDEFDCVSVFVIVGEKRALVVDTGTGIGDLKWIIEQKITDKPYDVVLTHNHGDHTGGAGFFDEMWIHAADMTGSVRLRRAWSFERIMRERSSGERIRITIMMWRRISDHGRRLQSSRG